MYARTRERRRHVIWLVSWMSWNCISPHPWHQLAATWVNTTRYCKYTQNTQLDATIDPKILLLCRIDTAQYVSGITMPIIRSPSNCRCSLSFPYECGGGSVLSRGRLRTLPSPHSYGNQRLQRQFDGLLMMGIVMPETCWAVSVQQSNKI